MEIHSVVLFASFFYLAAAYPYGAPEQACDTFRPNHVDRSTGQLYDAQNENDQLDLDDSQCPYDISYSSKFAPGETITLTISTRERDDYFRGYLLTVVQDDDDNAEPQGVFGSSSNTICNGAAVTQSNGSRKSFEEISWTAPADSSKKKFSVWMTVVKSFSRYWMNCSPIELPAIDADDDLITDPLTFDIPTESKEQNHPNDHDHDHHHDHSHGQDDDNNTSIFKSGEDRDSADSAATKEEASSSSLIESEEDPDSDGQDESGNSDENSIDVSDNRSGSSLNSEEKEEKRQKYFDEGIKNFDSDIKKLLMAVNKEGAYEQYKSEALRSGANMVGAMAVLVTAAVAMLNLA